MSPAHPLVSVVTVNFNGEHFLGDLLRSLQAQTYPHMEILVVDNGSSDGSVPFLRRHFPGVRVVQAGRNLGFTGGNNLGIEKSRGQYVALVNNDTVAHPEWLRHLVDEAGSDPSIGGVGSKILFARPFLPLSLEVTTVVPRTSHADGDSRELGVFVAEHSGFSTCAYRKAIFKCGFHGAETVDEVPGRWAGSRATLFFPVESLAAPGDLLLRLKGVAGSGYRQLRVGVGETGIADVQIGPRWGEHRVTVPPELARRTGFEVINNAASFLEQDGTAGDRGIYEPDRGQYDAAEDVSALCGCSMLLPRAVLDEVGAFDPDLFMYFEDTELSWRIRKVGYRLRYQPKSVVRHHHASTTVEWSPMFHFLVSRNRVLMVVRHAALRHAVRAYAGELGRLAKALLTRRSLRHPEVRVRLRVQLSLLRLAPRALLKRIRGRGAAPERSAVPGRRLGEFPHR